MARKAYFEEFRRDAVELYRSTPGATVVGIAGDLGTMDSTLSAWLKAAGVAVRAPGSATRTDPPPGGGSLDQELTRLRSRVREPTTLAALVLAAGLALTGCTNTPEPATLTATATEAPVETDAPVEPAAPEVTEASEVVAAPRTGDILAVAPTDLEVSQHAYPLADGTFILVNRYEPLPAIVAEAVQAQGDAGMVYEATGPSTATHNLYYAQGAAVRSAITQATGKNVITVARTNGGGCDAARTVDPWSYNGAKATNHGGCAAWATQAEAVAAAQGVVAAREDGGTYVVVVDQG